MNINLSLDTKKLFTKDPDAPTGSGFWHWVVFDIPADCNELDTNAGNAKLNLTPNGAIQSVTDYGIY